MITYSRQIFLTTQEATSPTWSWISKLVTNHGYGGETNPGNSPGHPVVTIVAAQAAGCPYLVQWYAGFVGKDTGLVHVVRRPSTSSVFVRGS